MQSFEFDSFSVSDEQARVWKMQGEARRRREAKRVRAVMRRVKHRAPLSARVTQRNPLNILVGDPFEAPGWSGYGAVADVTDEERAQEQRDAWDRSEALKMARIARLSDWVEAQDDWAAESRRDAQRGEFEVGGAAERRESAADVERRRLEYALRGLRREFAKAPVEEREAIVRHANALKARYNLRRYIEALGSDPNRGEARAWIGKQRAARKSYAAILERVRLRAEERVAQGEQLAIAPWVLAERVAA